MLRPICCTRPNIHTFIVRTASHCCEPSPLLPQPNLRLLTHDLASQESRLLVAEVGHITENGLRSLSTGRLLKGLEVGELKCRLYAVGCVGRELENLPAEQAFWRPLLLHERHVGGQVVGHVELGVWCRGIEDGDFGG